MLISHAKRQTGEAALPPCGSVCLVMVLGLFGLRCDRRNGLRWHGLVGDLDDLSSLSANGSSAPSAGGRGPANGKEKCIQ